MNLRHIFSIEVNYLVRHIKEFLIQKKPAFQDEALHVGKRVFFLDTPAYGNIGDQAIAFSMKKFVSKHLPDYGQVEITEDLIPQSIKWLKKNIRVSDIICLTGGGNMGTLYQRYEGVRRLILREFRHNPIVIFPQTFDYSDNLYDKWELYRARKVYCSCDNLTLCARDKSSFEKMQNSFQNCKVIFCPDIALLLDYADYGQRGESVGLCLRDDNESCISKSFSTFIKEEFSEARLLTTAYELTELISPENRKEVVEKKLYEFSQNKLIVTDRLHGVIFSYITNTPCIALPNSNGKVKNVCNYLSKTGNVVFCENIQEIKSAVFNKNKNELLSNQFAELDKVFRTIGV